MGISWAIYIYIYSIIIYITLYITSINPNEHELMKWPSPNISLQSNCVTTAVLIPVARHRRAEAGSRWHHVTPASRAMTQRVRLLLGSAWKVQVRNQLSISQWLCAFSISKYFNFLNKFNNEHDTSWHLGIGMDHIATFAASEISNISRINAEVWAQKAGCATWRGDIWCPIWDWLETGFSQGIPKSTAKTHQFFLKIPWLRGTPICIILHLGPFVSMVATDFFTAHSSAGGLRDGRSPVPSRTRSSCGCDFPAVNMWNRVVDHKICGIPMKSWGKYVEFLWNPTWNLIFEVPRGTTLPSNLSVEAETVRTHPRLRSCHHLALGHRPKHRRWHGLMGWCGLEITVVLKFETSKSTKTYKNSTNLMMLLN